MVAAPEQLRRQRALLGTQHVGGAQWVAEARQVDRLVQQLDADEPAALGQRQLLHACPVVVRQMLAAFGGIGARLQGLVMGILPGKPFSLDNFRSLTVDSVCHEDGCHRLGITPAAMLAVLPTYLAPRPSIHTALAPLA